MSFFEAPPPPPEPEVGRQPEWAGPPENVLPVPFELHLALARTPRIAVVAHSGLAYPNGFSFRLVLQRRDAVEGPGGDPFHHWHLSRSGEIPAEALRVGVQFADGGKATVFDRWFAREGMPSPPVMVPRGGGGGMKSWDFGFWIWPLPPEGPLSFVCEWPSEDVALTSIEVDAAPIREAATRAETLWPDDDGPSAGGGTVFSRQMP